MTEPTKDVLITYREKVIGIIQVPANETDGYIERKVKDWMDEHIEWQVLER